MITLPKEFVATRYPGYFWSLLDKKLYSIKVTGELSALKPCKGGFFFGREIPPGYKISVNGIRRYYTMEYLNKLTGSDKLQEIKVRK